MLKMNKASDAYARNSSIKDLAQVTDCPAKSEHARRAIALFPSTNDCRAVLENSMIENDYTAHEITFEQFMFSRNTSFPCEMLNASQIL